MNINKIKINWVYATKPTEDVQAGRYLLCVNPKGILTFRIWKNEREFRKDPLNGNFSTPEEYSPESIMRKHDILCSLGVMTLAGFISEKTDYSEEDIFTGKAPPDFKKFLLYQGFFGREEDIDLNVYEFDDEYFKTRDTLDSEEF